MDPSLIYIETRRFKDLPKTSEMTRIVLTAVDINTTPSNGYIKVFYDEHCTTLLKGESFSINKTSIPAIKYALFASNNTTNNKTLTSEDLGNILLHGADSYEEKRQILRRELIRWHPDKFTAQFGKVLVDEDRERILEAVTGMSQLLTQLHTEIQAERK